MALNENPSLANQAVSAKKIKCLRCKKDTFKSALGLAKHQDALGHHHFICPTCKKEFGTEKGRDDHKRSHNRRPMPKNDCTAFPIRGPVTQHEQQQTNQLQVQQQPQETPTSVAQRVEHLALAFSQSSGTTLDGYTGSNWFPGGLLNEVRLYCNGNFFMTLTPVEQDLVHANLITRCHSTARLQKQGYTMPNSTEANKVYPRKSTVPRYYFRGTPKPSLLQRRRAVVIDCEMVQVQRWRRDLAFLSAVDFLTGEVLINNYVQPTGKVTDWTTKISGITPAAMAEAVASGQALNGWQSAREALFNYVDAQTILIGHSLNSDLDVLGIYHTRVVDSVIVASEAVFGSFSSFNRLYSLKTLSEEFLNLQIQPENQSHVCLEDTFATRDVVLCFVQNPERLIAWGGIAKARYDAEQAQREARRRQKKEIKARTAAKQQQAAAEQPLAPREPTSQSGVYQGFSDIDEYGGCDGDSETLRWSDVAEACGWPHPDTGYDPLSD
ncbi:ribonuclease H-like domain-containing protein [Aspergillus coremiiformis]|uniref:Ribonuclease H-like domain-containing protein n=1 Tax=Aspergillus coremiiformis TaxID=138285 RepID=A0A5N6Z9Z3_9EURO|nr:ribonuclease H-like domain-containing protein [Aspergillus coremiiformis]